MDNEINEFLEKSVDEYVPFEKVLKTHGLMYQEGLRKSKEYYWKFKSLLRTLKIDTTSKESIYLSKKIKLAIYRIMWYNLNNNFIKRG